MTHHFKKKYEKDYKIISQFYVVIPKRWNLTLTTLKSDVYLYSAISANVQGYVSGMI